MSNIYEISSTKNTVLITLLVFSFVILCQSAIDIYLPSLPWMVKYFESSESIVRLSVPIFLVGCSFSQIFYGPYSDLVGRRPVLFIGLSIFLIGSVVSASSQTTIMLLIGRLIQGIGVGAVSVLSRAVSRDIFEGNKLVKIASYIAIAWALVPIIAPVVGAYIQYYCGWRMNFIILIAFSTMILLGIFLVLPETKKNIQRREIKLNIILKNYIYLLRNREFIGYTLCASVLFGIFVSFNVIAPFLIQNEFKFEPANYAWLNLIICSGYLIGSFINSKLIQYINISKIIPIGFILLITTSVAFLIFSLFFQRGVGEVIIFMFFVMLSIGLIYANCIAGSLMPFSDIAGSASALYGCLVLSGASIAGTIVSNLPIDQEILSLLILFQAIVSFAVYLIFLKKMKFLLKEITV